MVVGEFNQSSLWRCVFFFSSRRRHTRLVSDRSSDVCSSDLEQEADEFPLPTPQIEDALRSTPLEHAEHSSDALLVEAEIALEGRLLGFTRVFSFLRLQFQIGRASCRERV